MITPAPVDTRRRPRRHVATGALLAAIGLTLTIGALPAAAVTTTPYGVNLVKNPSFEAGAATLGYQAVAVPYWQTTGNMTVVKYGAPNGFPSLAEGARISGGKKFFTSGTPSFNGTCPGGALQVIRIRGRNAAIDAGRVKITFLVYMGTFGTQTDRAVVYVNAHNSAGGMIETTTGQSISQTNSQMYGLGGTNTLPIGTRSLRVFLAAEQTQGYCDAYFDRVRVMLSLIE